MGYTRRIIFKFEENFNARIPQNGSEHINNNNWKREVRDLQGFFRTCGWVLGQQNRILLLVGTVV